MLDTFRKKISAHLQSFAKSYAGDLSRVEARPDAQHRVITRSPDNAANAAALNPVTVDKVMDPATTRKVRLWRGPSCLKPSSQLVLAPLQSSNLTGYDPLSAQHCSRTTQSASVHYVPSPILSLLAYY